MAKSTRSEAVRKDVKSWLALVNDLMREVESWAADRHWAVHREEKTVRDVVYTLLDLTGSPLQPEFNDVQVPMLRRVGSSERAGRLLDWRATIPFREGMQRVVREQLPSGAPSVAPA